MEAAQKSGFLTLRVMSRRARIALWLTVFVIALGVFLAGRLEAQTFSILHSFTGPIDGSAGTDGCYPVAGLTLAGTKLYGTTGVGGASGVGTVFALNIDGSGFTNLHHFGGGNQGGDPWGSLVASGDTLYGTTYGGGTSSGGMVFKVNTDGTGFTSLHDFSAISTNFPGVNEDGNRPQAGLVLSGGILYGSTTHGGIFGGGTVFKVNTNGMGHQVLHNFSSYSDVVPTNTSYDGSILAGGVLNLDGNVLYGTTETGGTFGGGTVFAINTDGTGFRVLHHFAGSDGAGPFGGLIRSGNSLYGTASFGGNNGYGAVFKVNTDGTGFTNLHHFTGGSDGGGSSWRGLTLVGNTLYGTAGTVFSLNADGSGYLSLFDAGSDFPLVVAGDVFYGASFLGGSLQRGSVFSLSLQPQLSINRAKGALVLTWPTNYAGFDYVGYTLQSTTNLGSTAVWTSNLPAPVIVNGQVAMTNPISATQQFFRLSQ